MLVGFTGHFPNGDKPSVDFVFHDYGWERRYYKCNQIEILYDSKHSLGVEEEAHKDLPSAINS